MSHYKSWSGLNKQLNNFLCDALKNRISYFLTRYHEVHNSYGRATIRLDGQELVNFSWVEMYKQDNDANNLYLKTGNFDYNASELKEKWDKEATFSDYDFLEAATQFIELPINEALNSENYLIKIFAIMDRRVGKRTLERLRESEEYKCYPVWVQQFYELRLES